MKRILIFSLAYSPKIGGAEIAVRELTNRMPDAEFHLITLRFGPVPREERVGNVTVHRIGNGGSYLQKVLFAPRAAQAALHLHHTQPFDAFWAVMSYMLFPIVLLRLRRIRTPYLLTLQEGDPWEHMFSRWFIVPFRPLLSYGFQHATVIQTISTYLAQWARRMGYRGEIVVIPNGVDRKNFIAAMHPAVASGGIVNLVTASRLVPKNALDDVIRALTFLPKNVQFVVYGDGPDERALQRLAVELGVVDRVLWKGAVSHMDLARAFMTAHIFIRPSRSEGMGNAFIEAMAAGLPVVATQVGGISDFLFDEKRNPDKPPTGWAVDSNAPEQIAAAVKDIMTNPDKVTRVCRNALVLVNQTYDWDRIAGCMKDVFDRVASSR